MYTATQGACVFDSYPSGEEKQSIGADELRLRNIQMHISWGKKSNKRGKEACKHTLDRVPNNAPVRIRHMQEGG